MMERWNEPDFTRFEFAPVMDMDERTEAVDLSGGYDPRYLAGIACGVGGYNEKRNGMYRSPIYSDGRDVHMGVDIWKPAGSPVYAVYQGQVRYVRDNDNAGDYGPTVVTRHELDGVELFALYGHLSRASLEKVYEGMPVERGDRLGVLGTEEENGGWVPHLHFQLSWQDPGRADMPGVVAEHDRWQALRIYPDPRTVLGPIY